MAGKGGVGKTTVTAALATAAARTGASVLIVEVEGKSGLASCLGTPPLEYEEVQARPGLRARTLTPDQALLEYLEDRGLRRVSKRLVSSGALDVVATAVPGMKDILVLGKVKQLEQSGPLISSSSTRRRPATPSRSCCHREVCSTRSGSARYAAKPRKSSRCSPTRRDVA